MLFVKYSTSKSALHWWFKNLKKLNYLKIKAITRTFRTLSLQYLKVSDSQTNSFFKKNLKPLIKKCFLHNVGIFYRIFIYVLQPLFIIILLGLTAFIRLWNEFMSPTHETKFVSHSTIWLGFRSIHLNECHASKFVAQVLNYSQNTGFSDFAYLGLAFWDQINGRVNLSKAWNVKISRIYHILRT